MTQTEHRKTHSPVREYDRLPVGSRLLAAIPSAYNMDRLGSMVGIPRAADRIPHPRRAVSPATYRGLQACWRATGDPHDRLASQ
jgi:hypothetical protein